MNVINLVNHKLARWMIFALLGVSIALGVNQFVFALSVVSGQSMQPTLHNGDRLLINKFSIYLHSPNQGDVVTFQDPSNQGRYLVKRVIGIPGDRIEIKDGVLYRNDRKVDEPYINSRIEDGNYGPVVVKKGTVFVLGDNRHRYASRDSRYENVGLVPMKLLDGKVELILWRPSLSTFL